MIPRLVLTTISLCLFGILGLASPRLLEAAAPPELGLQESDFFYYPLRPGESLSDVGRIFRIPVEELIQLNQIGDANRLSIGQTIKIPDPFAREALMLRRERDQILEQKRQIERATAVHEQVVSGLESKIRELDGEKAAVTNELAATAQWHLAAKLLAALLLGTLVWALKAVADRAMLTRKLASVAAENAALVEAKARYREAASHLELRCQKLYRSKDEAPRDVVVDGTMRLARAFDQGADKIERLLASIRTEREKEEHFLDTESKVLAWLFHPVRELLARHG
jgi:murein DD-endopeptidase MepM/ murein hydrolase activator NlpD